MWSGFKLSGRELKFEKGKKNFSWWWWIDNKNSNIVGQSLSWYVEKEGSFCLLGWLGCQRQLDKLAGWCYLGTYGGTVEEAAQSMWLGNGQRNKKWW